MTGLPIVQCVAGAKVLSEGLNTKHPVKETIENGKLFHRRGNSIGLANAVERAKELQ